MQQEYGSDFHFMDFSGLPKSPGIQDIYAQSNLFFSGRTALYNLIQKGIALYNWQNIYLPEYYCHDVDAFIKALPVNIFYYNDGPYNTGIIDTAALDKENNIFIHVNYFGLNTQSRLQLKNAFVIEDHTHDLTSEWALNSTAHYCFASLRKSLPVAAGGIVWSPQQLELPQVTAEKNLGNTAAYMKLAAMFLKKEYLNEHYTNKQDFRNLFINSESLFESHETNGALPPIIQNAINTIPIELLRIHKINNYKQLSNAIHEKEIIWQQQIQDRCPFGCMLFFKEALQRDKMKAYLIKNHIYPAVLWPNQKEAKAKAFSEKVLLIHCDVRYNSADMQCIADTINHYAHAG
ncbi:hypothetical protein [Parafilimonas sp.]|uniref:hypothetical protein n=1 Tax=Parafilimonas sp. TaxID=1969739 RepID=UPI003F822010